MQSENPDVLPDFKTLKEFLREWSKSESFPEKYNTIRKWWPEVVGTDVPNKDIELLYLRVAYELQSDAYSIIGAEMPRKVKVNLKAARSYDVKAMDPGIRGLLSVALKTNQQQGDSMPKAKSTAKSGKTEGGRTGVSQYYLEIFEAQPKAQLTDAQIVDAIKAKTGKAPTAKSVASYRCMYNAGKIEGQKAVPAAKVKAVRVKKEKAKKPMSEETKAKLKAYTANKSKAKAKAKK